MDFDGMIYLSTLQNSSEATLIGQGIRKPAFCSRPRRAPAGVYWNQPETIDDVKRLISYRVVDDYPFIAMVGISRAAVFDQWNKVSHIYLWIGGFLTIAILGAIALGAIREKRLMAAKCDLERVNFWFDSALDSMGQGLIMYDASERLLLVNKRYLEMYDIAPGQIAPGDNIRKVFALRSEGRSPAEIEEYLSPKMKELRAGRAVDRVVERANGRFYAVSLRPVTGGGWVATHQDVTEQTRAEREVLHLAHYDALTDLTSRGLFQSHVDRAVMRLERHGERFNILMLDLDRFKAVNDSLGHLAGDRLLRQVAVRLESCAGRDDVVARLGGDEFAVLQVVHDESARRGNSLADRLLGIIGEPYDTRRQSGQHRDQHRHRACSRARRGSRTLVQVCRSCALQGQERGPLTLGGCSKRKWRSRRASAMNLKSTCATRWRSMNSNCTISR